MALPVGSPGARFTRIRGFRTCSFGGGFQLTKEIRPVAPRDPQWMYLPSNSGARCYVRQTIDLRCLVPSTCLK